MMLGKKLHCCRRGHGNNNGRRTWMLHGLAATQRGMRAWCRQAGMRDHRGLTKASRRLSIKIRTGRLVTAASATPSRVVGADQTC